VQPRIALSGLAAFAGATIVADLLVWIAALSSRNVIKELALLLAVIPGDSLW